MLEYTKQHWRIITTVFGFLTVAIPIWATSYMVLDGQEDIEKHIDAKWAEDKVFNEDWAKQDKEDERTLMNLLNDIKNGQTDIKVGIAALTVWQQLNSKEYDRFQSQMNGGKEQN